MKINKIILIGLAFIFCTQSVNAIVPTIDYGVPGTGPHQDTYVQPVAAISAVIAAGAVGVTIRHPDVVATSNAQFTIGGFSTGPDLVSGIIPVTATWTVTSLVGCTAASITQTDLFSAVVDTSTFTDRLTMTGNECTGIVTFQQVVGAGAVTIANIHVPFNVNTLLTHNCSSDTTQCLDNTMIIKQCNFANTLPTCTQPTLDNQNRLCDASAFAATCNDANIILKACNFADTLPTCTQPTMDNQNRLCDASAFGAACNDVNIIAKMCNFADTLPTCTQPTLDNLNRLCAASAFAATCNTALLIQKMCASTDSLPTCTNPIILQSNCLVSTFGTTSGVCQTVSGGSFPSTLNVIEKQCAASDVLPACTTPTYNNVLSGSLTIHQDALSGTINVVNSGGQAITLSGSLTVHQDALSGTINVVNSGGQSISITSWPQLQVLMKLCNSADSLPTCTMPVIGVQVSGTLITDSHVCNGISTTCIAVGTSITNNNANSNTGTEHLIIDSWPALLSTLSGGLTITDDANGWIIHQDPLSGTVNVVNSGGQNIVVTSWPDLIAHLDGDINIHQDEACGATITCHTDFMFTGNITSNMNSTTTSNVNAMLSLTPYHLLLLAIVFFAVIGEWKKDALYWFVCFLMSLYLLINRPTTSIIPLPIFVGWLFVVLYQTISLLSNGKAKNLSGDNDD